MDRVIDPIFKVNDQIVMPSKSNAIDQPDYDQHLYKARHLIENFFAKLKHYRGIATRYDKLAQNFLSAIYLTSTIIWLHWWQTLNLNLTQLDAAQRTGVSRKVVMNAEAGPVNLENLIAILMMLDLVGAVRFILPEQPFSPCS